MVSRRSDKECLKESGHWTVATATTCLVTACRVYYNRMRKIAEVQSGCWVLQEGSGKELDLRDPVKQFKANVLAWDLIGEDMEISVRYVQRADVGHMFCTGGQ